MENTVNAQYDSYEIYKNHPEAFTLPEISDELAAAIQAEKCKKLPARQLLMKNFHTFSTKRNRPKNKGRKKKERGMRYKEISHSPFGPQGPTNDPIKTKEFLLKTLPPGVVQRVQPSNIYVLCPFHKERSASMALATEEGIAKCFGCGRSYTIPTFLSITLGGSRVYRWQRFQEANGRQGHTAKISELQLRLPFPEDSPSTPDVYDEYDSSHEI